MRTLLCLYLSVALACNAAHYVLSLTLLDHLLQYCCLTHCAPVCFMDFIFLSHTAVQSSCFKTFL